MSENKATTNTVKVTSPSTTITVEASVTPQPQEDTIELKLRKPSGDRKVKWSSETVDNEHLDKKKSKCCCIYKKPRAFGESSSEDEDDDDGNCDHHENHHQKNRARKPPSESDEGLSGDAPASTAISIEQVVLRMPELEQRETRVNYTADTIDNEDANKRKSKKCCIYSKPRAFGESSSSSSSSSNSGSDEDLQRTIRVITVATVSSTQIRTSSKDRTEDDTP